MAIHSPPFSRRFPLVRLIRRKRLAHCVSRNGLVVLFFLTITCAAYNNKQAKTIKNKPMINQTRSIKELEMILEETNRRIEEINARNENLLREKDFEILNLKSQVSALQELNQTALSTTKQEQTNDDSKLDGNGEEVKAEHSPLNADDNNNHLMMGLQNAKTQERLDQLIQVHRQFLKKYSALQESYLSLKNEFKVFQITCKNREGKRKKGDFFDNNFLTVFHRHVAIGN